MANSLRVRGILETSVYVDDLDRAHAFYGDILGLERMVSGDRLSAYDAAPGETLLVFLRGATSQDVPTSGGLVPGHHSEGPSHFAFKVAKADLNAWRAHFAQAGVSIVSEVTWPAGGVSLYVNDPDGNVVEFAAPALWPNYRE
ncbi:VOC family protein [Stappia stellulata]|uniref:VOC family protein n=1 Tax=Stappia stellulata TaxID=71235 RepID=UPI00048EF79C|nr:VOC family protein [Stappia stellulata]